MKRQCMDAYIIVKVNAVLEIFREMNLREVHLLLQELFDLLLRCEGEEEGGGGESHVIHPYTHSFLAVILTQLVLLLHECAY